MSSAEAQLPGVSGRTAAEEATDLLDPWVVVTAGDGDPALTTLKPEALVKRLLANPDLLARLAIDSGGMEPEWTGREWLFRRTHLSASDEPKGASDGAV